MKETFEQSRWQPNELPHEVESGHKAVTSKSEKNVATHSGDQRANCSAMTHPSEVLALDKNWH